MTTKTFSKTLENVSITVLALAAGLILSLKSGDIINNQMAAFGYRDRDFLAYVRFFVVFVTPVVLWLVVFLTTAPVSHPVRRQLRFCTGIGFALAVLAGELVAVFTFLVRYV